MKKLLLVVPVIVVAGGLGIWLFAQQFDPPPVPPTVSVAEDALALPGMFGLAHVNVEYAASLQEAMLGPPDLGALLTPAFEDDSGWNALRSKGFDPHEALDHIIAAVHLTNEGVGAAAVMLGDFPVDPITQILQQQYSSEPTTLSGEPGYLVTWEDSDTCEIKGPVALHLTENRIVFGTPSVVEQVVTRLSRPVPPAQDLGTWRSFRQDRIASLTLLSVPPEASDNIENPFAKAGAKKIQEALGQVESFYLAAGAAVLPPSVNLTSEMHASTPEWPSVTEKAYRDWEGKFEQDFAEDLPTLARLVGHLTVQADGNRLLASLSLGRDFAEDLREVVSEAIRLAFSSGGLKTTQPHQAQEEEKILQPEKVTKFVPSLSHHDLADFDQTKSFAREQSEFSGPFSVSIRAVRLWKTDASVREIEIEASSGEIQNMGIDSMHDVKGQPRAQLVVTQIQGAEGANLMREETCGKDRNHLGAELAPRDGMRYVDGKWFQVPEVHGKKTVRLKEGARLKDVQSLEGHVRLRLPTRTGVRRVEAPFEGKVVELDDVRLKLVPGGAGDVKYELSGQADRVLAVRALNGKGEYLQSAGSPASPRLLGRGKSVTKRFKGQPKAAEIIIAVEEAERDYPFTLQSLDMAASHTILSESPAVPPMDRAQFAAKFASSTYDAPCEENKPEAKAGPFVVCTLQFRRLWGSQLYNRLRVLAPQSEVLEDNPSALEIVVESVYVETEDGMRSFPVDMSEYATLAGSSGRNHLRADHALSGESPDGLSPDELSGMRGKLIARLPKRLARVTLDVTELGMSTNHPSGLEAQLVEISGSSMHIDLTGARDRLVQFVPRDAEGKRLRVMAPNLNPAKDEADKWECQLTVYGKPHSLDIVFAQQQDRLEYPFDLPISK